MKPLMTNLPDRCNPGSKKFISARKGFYLSDRIEIGKRKCKKLNGINTHLRLIGKTAVVNLALAVPDIRDHRAASSDQDPV